MGLVLFGFSCGSPNGPTNPSTPPPPQLSPLRVNGIVRDTVGRAIPDVRVRVVFPDGSDLVATTHADGRFSLADSTPVESKVSLQVSRDGYFPAFATAPNNNEREVTISLTPTDLLGLEGQYTATITAAGSCTELPAVARNRTYVATIQPNPSYKAGFFTTLSGANLVPSYDRFYGNVADAAARFSVYSWDAFAAWLEDQPIIERLDANASVSFMGTAATGEPVRSTASVTATFDGVIAYCSAVKEPRAPTFPLECAAAPVECKSSQHRIQFTRR